MIAVIAIVILLILLMVFALCKVSGDCSRAEETQGLHERNDLKIDKESLDEP